MLRRILLLSLASLLVAGLAFPQTQLGGRLEGVVTDGQGLVLPGVSITLSGSAQDRFANSAVDGSYRFLALPPGDYILSFALAGFQTVNREGVRVVVGSTFSINQSLDLATVAETITVTGESPVVDVKTTGVTATFDQTQLDDVPSATDMWAVLGQSPGVRMRGYDVGGSHKSQQSGYETFGVRSQNRIINEGVNTTEGTGGAGGYYDYYSMDTFTVSGSGADVEMSTPGAQVVATVKSGGNEFSSMTNVDIQPAGEVHSPFVTNNIDSDIESRGGSPSAVREFFEFHIDVGGPFVKDKAWFFGAYNYFKIDRAISGQPVDVATDIGLFDMPSAKVNWQMTEKDQFVGYSQWSLKQKPFRGLSARIPAESIRAQDSWTWLHKAEWQRVWSDRLFSNILVAHFGFGWPMVPAVDAGTPTAGGQTRPARIDVSGDQRGAGWQPFTFNRYKPHSTGQFSYYIPSAAGSHDFKFGWDWQVDSRQFGWNTNSGALRYYDNSNLGPAPATSEDPGQLGAADEIRFYNVPTAPDDRNRHTDFYVQDTWTVNDRLTLTMGVRTGHQSLYYLDASNDPVLNDPSFFEFQPTDVPGAHVKSWSNVAPRLGFTYDVTGRGQTVFKGYFGRYYAQIGTGMPDANPAGQLTEEWTWNDLNQNGFYDGIAELGDFLNCFGPCGGGVGALIASDAVLLYTDEISASIEHELMADTSVRFSFVRKMQRNRFSTSGGMSTLNLARATELLTAPFVTTCDNCPGSFAGTTLNLRTLPDGAPTSNNVYANAPGETDGNYNTYQFAFNRRFRSDFFFNVSGDFMTRDELIRASGESGSPLSSDPIDRAWLPAYNTAIGQTQDTTSWSLRASGRYELAREVGLAMTYRHQSGWPWAPIHRVSLPNVGTQPFFLEPVNANRSEGVHIVDFRLDKSLTFGDRFRAKIMVDVFNLLNTNAVTNFRLRTGGSFNNVIDWIPGRTLKLGFRFQF